MSLRAQRDYLDEQDWGRPRLGTRNSSDLGSWPEPGERVTTLLIFRECCAEYYRHGGAGRCMLGRLAAWGHLRYCYKKMHRLDQLMRWRPAIERVLDRAEAEVRDGSSL